MDRVHKISKTFYAYKHEWSQINKMTSAMTNDESFTHDQQQHFSRKNQYETNTTAANANGDCTTDLNLQTFVKS